MNIHKKDKGFTLIELLVVISIIGLLSSVVLANLKSARNKAKIAQYKQQMVQFANLLELEYSNTGSYSALATPTGWVATTGACDTVYASSASSFKSTAIAMCKSLVTTGGVDYPFYVIVTAAEKYSINGWLNNADGLLYCVGSSGKSFGKDWAGGTCYNNIGCLSNP